MEKPKVCVICRETKFKFHDTIKIYNPETDIEEDITNVYECDSCNTYHFETEEHIVVQYEKNINVPEYNPQVA